MPAGVVHIQRRVAGRIQQQVAASTVVVLETRVATPVVQGPVVGDLAAEEGPAVLEEPMVVKVAEEHPAPRGHTQAAAAGFQV
jgi:hypothetical protein